MAPLASIRLRANMSTVMTRSTANGADRRPTVPLASTPPRASTATVPARTSASGAAPRQTEPPASTARPEDTRSSGCWRGFAAVLGAWLVRHSLGEGGCLVQYKHQRSESTSEARPSAGTSVAQAPAPQARKNDIISATWGLSPLALRREAPGKGKA